MGSVLVVEVFVCVLELLGYGECAGCRGICECVGVIGLWGVCWLQRHLRVCWSYWVMGSVLVAEAFVSVLELLGYGECAGCRGICECVGVIGLWGVCWLQRYL